MSIPLQLEDIKSLRKWGLNLDRVLERCVFCFAETKYWHVTSNTPVCTCCAGEHEESEIPAARTQRSNELKSEEAYA